jgi:transcriptional regulator with XRE-family HTH domain
MINEEEFINRFVDIVQKEIKKQNITQETLAFKAELSTITINRLLNGHKRRITAYLMMKIIKALDISLKEIERII